MSKYDNLDYLTLAEKKGSIPNCIKNNKSKDITVPEELYGMTVENLKKYLRIRNDKEENNFLFANKNQTIINQNYFKNGNFFSENMEKDEKREFLLDYLNYNFGNEVDGKYFEDHLQDIFNLRHYNLIAEDFDLMISEYFKKKDFDLNDPEDRKEFKKIIFPQSIHFLSKEEAKEREMIEENSNNENNDCKSNEIST